MSSDVLWTQLAEKGRGGMLRFEDDHWIEFRIVPETIVSGTGGYQFFARMESSLITGRETGICQEFGTAEFDSGVLEENGTN